MVSRFISIVLSVAVVVGLALVPVVPVANVALAQPYVIGLNVTPADTCVGPGASGTFFVWVDNPASQYYDSVGIRMVYDTTYITIDAVTNNPAFDFGPIMNYANPAWSPPYGLISSDNIFFSGTSNDMWACRVDFTSTGTLGVSPLDFIYMGDDEATNVLLCGTSVLNWSMVSNGSVTTSPPDATLDGHLSFPGNNAGRVMTVRFFGNSTQTEEGWSPKSATTDADGNFTIDNLTPGTYDVSVKNWTCLTEVERGIVLTHNTTTYVNFGSSREGDSNDDNGVSIVDISILIAAYGTTPGDGDWNQYCDFNRDGGISIADISILIANYGDTGDPYP